MLHHNVQLHVSFVNASIVVANDIWVLKVSQNIDLGYDLLLFFVVHFAIVQLFPDENAAV